MVLVTDLLTDCSTDETRCDNGVCRPSALWCNQKDDCGDWSDEKQCGTCVDSHVAGANLTLGAFTFRISNGITWELLLKPL